MNSGRLPSEKLSVIESSLTWVGLPRGPLLHEFEPPSLSEWTRELMLVPVAVGDVEAALVGAEGAERVVDGGDDAGAGARRAGGAGPQAVG